MSWTEERIDQAIELFISGKSAGEIALVLGGVTRNAVIGKLHRLGYSRKAMGLGMPQRAKPRAKTKPVEAKQAPARRRKRKPIKITIPKAELKGRSMRDGGAIDLIELSAGTCRFPITAEGPHHRFCGASPIEGSVYCEQHHALCHEKPAETKKRAGGRFDYNPHRRAA